LIKVLLPTDAQNNCLKGILKFTLKQLQHVSALSPSSGSVQFELAKITFATKSYFWICFHVNFNILLKQLFCASVGNETLIVSRCMVRL
jgi:hypothetical protein